MNKLNEFPKEFGDRSDLGLGALRSLHDIPNLPYAKVESGDTTTIKGNGFDTVTRKPALNVQVAQYVSSAQFALDQGYVDSFGKTYTAEYVTLCLGGAPGAPFRRKTIAGGDGFTYAAANGRYYGLQRSLVIPNYRDSIITTAPFQMLPGIISQVDDTSVFRVFRVFPFGKLDTLSKEAQDRWGAARVKDSAFVNRLLHSHVSRNLTGQVMTEHESLVYSQYDTDFGCIVPRAIVTTAPGGWAYNNEMQFYPDYDHFTALYVQLSPRVTLVCHIPARLEEAATYTPGATFIGSGLPVYPDRDAAVARVGALANYFCRKPLFQVSNDNGVNFFAIGSLDHCFDGADYEDAQPLNVLEKTYFAAMNSFGVLSLRTAHFISLELQVKTASVSSIARNGKLFEYRMFRTSFLNFSSFTTISPPPGYGTVWGGSVAATLRPAFACTVEGPGKGLIGYQTVATDSNNASLLFVSATQGTTWEPARPLPSNGIDGNFVGQLNDRELYYTVQIGQQVGVYLSQDFGLTWQLRSLTAGLLPNNPFRALPDIQRVIAEDGSRPSPTPMTPWLYDEASQRS